MRREMKEYEKLFKDNTPWMKRWAADTVYKLRRFVWRHRLRGLHAGSEVWHRLQQKIASLPDTTADNAIRSLFYEESLHCQQIYVQPNTIFCYPYRVHMGFNVFINRNVYITARADIFIGNHVMIGPGVVINSGMHAYDRTDVLIRDQGHIIAPIRIGSDVWIGANAVIMPGITIGDGAVIGAGSIVTKSVLPDSVVAGVPAKMIRMRGTAKTTE